MSSASDSGQLYVVSTPIGNMGDFSFRALEVLRSVSLVLAEDTRHSRRLFTRYEIATPLAAHHAHNEARTTPGLVARLVAGESLALITDAGTPLVSDPGARLVRAAIDAGVTVVPVPGASATLAALVASGVDASRFTFYGFLPRSGRDRSAVLAEIGRLAHTAVLYEAPPRLVDTLGDLAAHGGGDRGAAVARELTKQFEEIRRGTLTELRAYYEGSAPRGEIVIVLSGVVPRETDAADTITAAQTRARSLRAAGTSTRDITSTLVQELGLARNAAYRIAREKE